MNHRAIIESQIDLLAKLNQQLAKQTTPEAAREIRENALAILRLTEIEATVKAQGVLEDLEERLEAMEEAIFGEEEVERLNSTYNTRQMTFVQYIRNCRDDLDTIYDVWGPALDRHLGEGWSDEAGE